MTLDLFSFIRNERKSQKWWEKDKSWKVTKHPLGLEPRTFDFGRCSFKGPLLKFQVYPEKNLNCQVYLWVSDGRAGDPCGGNGESAAANYNFDDKIVKNEPLSARTAGVWERRRSTQDRGSQTNESGDVVTTDTIPFLCLLNGANNTRPFNMRTRLQRNVEFPVWPSVLFSPQLGWSQTCYS